MAVVTRVLPVRCKLGEGPLWDWREQVLHWVDIDLDTLHRYDPATGRHDVCDIGLAVGCLALRKADGLLLATRHGFASWDWDSRKLEFLADPERDQATRFNDGAVDNQGRFWAGTIALDPNKYHLATNRLYRFDPDGTVHLMETGLTISNGLGWSPDSKTMYLTDTMQQMIYAYDFDASTGTISHRRTFVQTLGQEGYPDGLTVDAEGYVWSARIAAWQLIRYDPSGQVERKIALPVKCPTSCAFGGSNLDQLYITSSWHILTDEEKGDQPEAGDLFVTSPGVRGQRANLFAG